MILADHGDNFMRQWFEFAFGRTPSTSINRTISYNKNEEYNAGGERSDVMEREDNFLEREPINEK